MTAEPDDKGIVKAGGFSRRIGGGHVFLNRPYKPCVMFKSESMVGFSMGNT